MIPDPLPQPDLGTRPPFPWAGKPHRLSSVLVQVVVDVLNEAGQKTGEYAGPVARIFEAEIPAELVALLKQKGIPL